MVKLREGKREKGKGKREKGKGKREKGKGKREKGKGKREKGKGKREKGKGKREKGTSCRVGTAHQAKYVAIYLQKAWEKCGVTESRNGPARLVKGALPTGLNSAFL
jgi:hypothetical protein